MKYADLKKNDIANGDGVNVSFWVQGCPHHCFNCHNPETWDFNGGKEFTQSTLDELIKAINTNGVMRNLSILGGEPLCDENLFLTNLVVQEVRSKFPNIRIMIWTGYTTQEIMSRRTGSSLLNQILHNSNILITGRYVDALRDIRQPLYGSTNQEVVTLHNGEIIK